MRNKILKLWGIPMILAIISLYALISALIGGIVIDIIASILLMVLIYIVVKNYISQP